MTCVQDYEPLIECGSNVSWASGNANCILTWLATWLDISTGDSRLDSDSGVRRLETRDSTRVRATFKRARRVVRRLSRVTRRSSGVRFPAAVAPSVCRKSRTRCRLRFVHSVTPPTRHMPSTAASVICSAGESPIYSYLKQLPFWLQNNCVILFFNEILNASHNKKKNVCDTFKISLKK